MRRLIGAGRPVCFHRFAVVSGDGEEGMRAAYRAICGEFDREAAAFERNELSRDRRSVPTSKGALASAAESSRSRLWKGHRTTRERQWEMLLRHGGKSPGNRSYSSRSRGTRWPSMWAASWGGRVSPRSRCLRDESGLTTCLRRCGEGRDRNRERASVKRSFS